MFCRLRSAHNTPQNHPTSPYTPSVTGDVAAAIDLAINRAKMGLARHPSNRCPRKPSIIAWGQMKASCHNKWIKNLTINWSKRRSRGGRQNKNEWEGGGANTKHKRYNLIGGMMAGNRAANRYKSHRHNNQQSNELNNDLSGLLSRLEAQIQQQHNSQHEKCEFCWFANFDVLLWCYCYYSTNN